MVVEESYGGDGGGIGVFIKSEGNECYCYKNGNAVFIIVCIYFCEQCVPETLSQHCLYSYVWRLDILAVAARGMFCSSKGCESNATL